MRTSTRRLTIDVAIAVALGGYAFASGLTSTDYPQPGLATALLAGGSGLALALRRIRPTAGFTLSMGLLTITALVLGPYQAGSSVLIAVVACFSAVEYGVRWPVFAALVGAFALIDNRGTMPEALGGVAFVVILLALAGGGGYLVRRLRQLSAANIALRELVEMQSAATTRAAVDDERQRVARELHDILSHSLGVVVLQTSAAEHAWASDPTRAREALVAARVTSLEAIEQLRTLLSVVRDDPTAERTPIPGIDDLPALAARTTAAGFPVDFDVTGPVRPVPAQIQASLFRVTQEGISNAMKHSGSAGCRIRLEYQLDAVVVEVVDAGGGTTVGAGSHLGLAGVRERALLYGGDVEAGPIAAGGWRLKVAFPS
jgi:signal transduction histidine kinase